jgi:hypothetical protein
MKIAEALRERGDLQKELGALKHRISVNARTFEGEDPDEDPLALLTRAREVITRLEHLVSRINATNAVTMVSPEVTVTQAMAQRASLNGLRTFLTEAAEAAGGDRHGLLYGRKRTELKELSALPIKDLREETDRIARKQRELDSVIQQLNWSTDLL